MEVPALFEAGLKLVQLKRAETGADEKDVEEKTEAVRKQLALYEDVLSKSPFLAGDTFTLADVAAGALHSKTPPKARHLPLLSISQGPACQGCIGSSGDLASGHQYRHHAGSSSAHHLEHVV